MPQVSQTYLKSFIWLENLIKIHLEYYEKYFLGFCHHFTRSGIFHNLSINALIKLTYSLSVENKIKKFEKLYYIDSYYLIIMPTKRVFR